MVSVEAESEEFMACVREFFENGWRLYCVAWQIADAEHTRASMFKIEKIDWINKVMEPIWFSKGFFVLFENGSNLQMAATKVAATKVGVLVLEMFTCAVAL